MEHLVRQFLHEDQGADEDVGVGHVSLELLQDGWVAKLLQQVSHGLHSDAFFAVVDGVASLGEGGLVLRL